MAKYLTATLFLCIPVFLSAQTRKPDPKFVASEQVLVVKPQKTPTQQFFIIHEKPVTKEEFNRIWYAKEQTNEAIKNQQQEINNNNKNVAPHKP